MALKHRLITVSVSFFCSLLRLNGRDLFVLFWVSGAKSAGGVSEWYFLDGSFCRTRLG